MSVGFLGEGHKSVSGIISLDSDLGYTLYSSLYRSKYNPFVKNKLKFYNVPVFSVGRSEAHFKMIDSFSLAMRYYLMIDSMKHNDFTSQGAIGKYYCLPYTIKKEHYEQVVKNYLGMCVAICKFVGSYKNEEIGLKKDDINIYKYWNFAVSRPGEKLPLNLPFAVSENKCPATSQFLDVIYSMGLKEAENIYTRCTDSTFRQVRNLLDILEALYVDAKMDTTIEFLNWMDRVELSEKKLKNIFLIVLDKSFWDRGDGYHYEKADSVYEWMVEKYSGNVYGYMGRLLVSAQTDKIDQEIYCKKTLEIEPAFVKRKGNSFWEDRVVYSISSFLRKQK